MKGKGAREGKEGDTGEAAEGLVREATSQRRGDIKLSNHSPELCVSLGGREGG